jgi:hypothetical protein
MRPRDIKLITAAAGLFVSLTTAALAQTPPVNAAPAINPVAPGPGLTSVPIGGIGEAGIPLATGSSGINQVGPGGIRLAPSGGSVSGVPLVTRPAEPGARRMR